MQKFSGVAVKGQGRASALGYPTANIPLTHNIPSGIYAGKVSVKGKEYAAAIYADPDRKLLEAHLLDFTDNLNLAALDIVPTKKIRENQNFENDLALRKAIENDIKKVRQLNLV